MARSTRQPVTVLRWNGSWARKNQWPLGDWHEQGGTEATGDSFWIKATWWQPLAQDILGMLHRTDHSHTRTDFFLLPQPCPNGQAWSSSSLCPFSLLWTAASGSLSFMSFYALLLSTAAEQDRIRGRYKKEKRRGLKERRAGGKHWISRPNT